MIGLLKYFVLMADEGFRIIHRALQEFIKYISIVEAPAPVSVVVPENDYFYALCFTNGAGAGLPGFVLKGALVVQASGFIFA